MKLMLTPSVSINMDQYAPPLDTMQVLLTTPPAVLKLGLAARETIESESHQKEVQRQDLPSPDAEIICLGTGSALPSKYRNVSSTLLRVPGSGSYLLDCGENTLGQLKRLYGPEQLSELLRDLKLIWISHLHADHHLGLTSVIKAWYEEIHGQKIGTEQEPRTPPRKRGSDQGSWIPVKDSLVLVSSHSMTEFLREYSQVEDFGFDHVTKLYTRGAYDGNPHSMLYYDNCRIGFDIGPEER
jgi:ribonuclease Z